MHDWTLRVLQSGTTFIVPTAKECIQVCSANRTAERCKQAFPRSKRRVRAHRSRRVRPTHHHRTI